MIRRSLSTAACALTAAVVAALAAPALASAHGLVGKQDLPIPRWLFAWGATIVLGASFAGLALLWSRPRLQEPRERRVIAVPRVLEPLAGLVGVAVFVLTLYAGLAGAQVDTANLAPTMIFVIVWVGVPFVSVLAGDVFHAFSPWRAIGRASGWVARRIAGGALPAPLAYPERFGRWPAVAGVLAFVWVELVDPNRGDPSHIATLTLIYAAIQLLGMSLYGERAWTANGDGIGGLFALFARLAPLAWREGALWRRPPLSGAPGLPTPPGTVALLIVAIGSTSFDGFSMGSTWLGLAPHLQRAFTALGLSESAGLQVATTLGLLAMILAIGGLYRLGADGVRSVAPGISGGAAARMFAHSLIPIAFAYLAAHYFSLIAYQGQAIVYLASDPLGRGSDLLGTAGVAIDYTWIGATGIWYVQVAALLGGHIAGLVLAHDRALARFADAKVATRSQYWMLAVMVTYTCLGLWLLSAAA